MRVISFGLYPLSLGPKGIFICSSLFIEPQRCTTRTTNLKIVFCVYRVCFHPLQVVAVDDAVESMFPLRTREEAGEEEVSGL